MGLEKRSVCMYPFFSLRLMSKKAMCVLELLMVNLIVGWMLLRKVVNMSRFSSVPLHRTMMSSL